MKSAEITWAEIQKVAEYYIEDFSDGFPDNDEMFTIFEDGDIQDKNGHLWDHWENMEGVFELDFLNFS